MDEQTEAIMEELGLPGETPGVTLVNQTDLDDSEIVQGVRDALFENDQAELANALSDWASSAQGSGSRRRGGIFQQDRYVVPDSVFEQFRTATDAAKSDDVVSNAVETTEMLAFKGVAINTGEDEEDDVARQILDDINLKTKMRQVWRELFMVSQCYISVSWKRKTYSVKHAKTANGKKSKKKYVNLKVPESVMILDPCRVIPHGMFAFGDEQLLYIADSEEEMDTILQRMNVPGSKESRLFLEQYIPTELELTEFTKIIGKSHDDRGVKSGKAFVNIAGKGGLAGRLLVLNPANSWRITHTRPDYQRFADVRLVSIFEILDLKNNLRESDRVDILGNLNSIVLVRKGNDKNPASASELAKTSASMRSGSKIPIIISDHRLEIEIITRKTDKTLQPERYNTLNSSLTSRLYQVLNTGNYASGTAVDDSSKLFKIIASSMEARRDEIRESITDKLIDKIWEDNDNLVGEPTMDFYPRRVSLEFDPQYSMIMFDLFNMGHISRETMLLELDIDQDSEAAKRLAEDASYEDVFVPREAVSNATSGRVLGGPSGGGGENQRSYTPTNNTPNPDTTPNSGDENKD